MTIPELAKQCVESLNHPERSLPDKPLITLVGKRGGLFPKGGGPRPKRLLCVNSRNEHVWHYDAQNVLAALVAHGHVTLQREAIESGSQDGWKLYTPGELLLGRHPSQGENLLEAQ